MYKPVDIANYFIGKGIEGGNPLNPMQVLKLVYISYGWYLALGEKELFDERIEAWTYGPVIPSVYHNFKHFGRSPITEITPTDVQIDAEVIGLLDAVWNKYSHLNGLQLSDITHREGTPWREAKNSNRSYLTRESIRSHYRKLAGLDVGN